jgi:hypothetical protein
MGGGSRPPYSVRSAQPFLEIDQCNTFFIGFVAGFRPWPAYHDRTNCKCGLSPSHGPYTRDKELI